jgi:hypothetical protein
MRLIVHTAATLMLFASASRSRFGWRAALSSAARSPGLYPATSDGSVSSSVAGVIVRVWIA